MLTITKLDPAGVSLLLLAFGFGAAAGNTVGGYLTDRTKIDTLTAWALGVVTLALIMLWISDAGWLPTSVLLALVGFAGFGCVPALQSRMMALARRFNPAAIDVASGLNIAALNSGIALGFLVGSGSVTLAGLRQAPAVAALITALAVILTLWPIRSSQARAP